MSISEKYSMGLRDLLIKDDNTNVLLHLARSVTQNLCITEDPEVALRYLMAQFNDIHKLLHKRLITKDMLFRYLHDRLKDTLTDFTKADLVIRVIQYWDQTPNLSTANSEVITTLSTVEATEQDYPIHLMARKFGEWFFDKFNASNLNATDLWSDAVLQLDVIADDGTSELECAGADEVLSSLFSAKEQFGFFFNPNLSHSGVQGRIDAYGQVVVLCCGTLHTLDKCVGVFECAFGVLRDPHAANNWKPKKFKFLLRSKLSPPQLHTLNASETLQAALALPPPSDTLD